MSSHEDIVNAPVVKRALSELGAEMHFSSETLVSYVFQELSDNARSKVASHLKVCRACSDIAKVVQNAISTETESKKLSGELEQPLSLPPKLQRKARLVAVLSAKTEVIIEDIAKLLLDEEYWPLIRPILKVMETQDRVFQGAVPSEATELPVAAFTSSPDPDEARSIEIVVRIADSLIIYGIKNTPLSKMFPNFLM